MCQRKPIGKADGGRVSMSECPIARPIFVTAGAQFAGLNGYAQVGVEEAE